MMAISGGSRISERRASTPTKGMPVVPPQHANVGKQIGAPAMPQVAQPPNIATQMGQAAMAGIGVHEPKPVQQVVAASTSSPSQDITVNPSATPQGQPILNFFGGYSTQQSTPSSSTSATPIGSKASFCSLQPKPDDGIPAHAYRSDPCHMSSYVDPQYAPGVRGADEHLALIPNIYNPKTPLAMNVTQDETLAIYETLHRMRAEKERQRQLQLKMQEEDRALYGGSTDKVSQYLTNFSHNLVTGYQVQPGSGQSTVGSQQLPLMPPSSAPAPQRQLAVQAQTGGSGGFPQPTNPVLASALYQALRDDKSANSGVNMDDIRNMMLNQGRSAVSSRIRNPPPPKPDTNQQQ